ncbi:hypothetical protein [Aminobacter sp. HY435]|uniref:hypothetical protein n=1 Tax=Aminobacter sp. HY435 TaxID=2970917 RepID=UPI0022B986B7|nr:hypothetical protein [Aminobacter sp. HY435]
MDVKEAVKAAKNYVSDLLAEEGMTNLGLEEIEFDDAERTWNVTLGFSRPWNSQRNALTTITGDNSAKRAYRVVKVRDKDGEILSVKRRELVE